jgi:hypothetical protein
MTQLTTAEATMLNKQMGRPARLVQLGKRLRDLEGAATYVVGTDGQIIVAGADGVPKAVTMSGANTITNAGVVSFNNLFPVDVAHSYANGHADWTLSATEKLSQVLIVTLADQAANIIGPAENRQYIVRNASGAAITLKKAAGTGVAVANGKTAILRYSDSVGDYIRVTADATH